MLEDMHGTYIIYSKTLDRYYIGSTSNFSERLKYHLYNHKGYTARAKDWVYVYHCSFESKVEATQHEREIKRWKSRQKLEELIISDRNEIDR